jgi:uncharacterized protein YjdB
VVRWSSSNAAVGTVSDAGLFSAVAVGSTTITATSEGASSTATMAVLPVPVASVSVTPTAGTLLVGQSLQLAAAGRPPCPNCGVPLEATGHRCARKAAYLN